MRDNHRIQPLIYGLLDSHGIKATPGIDRMAFHTICQILHGVVREVEPDAEDVLIEVLGALRAHLETGKIKSLDNSTAYVLRAVKHRALNHIRNVKSRKTEEFSNAIAGCTFLQPSEVNAIEAADLLRKVSSYVSSENWQIFVFLEFDGMSSAEVGEMLGRSAVAIRQTKMKTVKKLRDAIALELGPRHPSS